MENSVRVYASIRTISHSDLCHICHEGVKILGGGTITLLNKNVEVSGASVTYGSLPNKILKEYFTYFGYKVNTRMDGNLEDKTKKWFIEHQIAI
ncbi:hypothetical protein HYS31_02740 [Candidatus Woesearchaeota archaeon]|nr:hypothetical protein [Candidatus Woesearchaeota archaeon]